MSKNKNTIMRKIFSITFIMAFLLIAVPVFATDEQSDKKSKGATISPAVIELDSYRGDTIYGYFTYANNTGADQNIYLEVVPYALDKDDIKTAVFHDDEKNPVTSPAKEWIILPAISNPIVRNGETKKINFAVTIPEDAEYGSYNNAIFVSGSPNVKPQDVSGNIINYCIAVLTVLNVKSDSGFAQYLEILSRLGFVYYFLAAIVLLIVLVILLTAMEKKNHNPFLENKKGKK